MSAAGGSGAGPRPQGAARGDGGQRDLALDAMRGVAILMVVGYHAGPLGWRLPPFGLDGWLVPPRLGAGWLLVPLLHFGFAGVHLFFVISGLCIHQSCRLGRDLLRPSGAAPVGAGADAEQGPGLRLDLTGAGARRYALRRLVRIAPPYWIALALFGLLLPALATAVGRSVQPAGAADLVSHALFLHNLSPRTIFSINPAFWSMATEVQFYLAYPVIAWGAARLGIERVVVATLVVELAWRATVLVCYAPTVEHFMIYRVWVHGLWVPRWFEWALGCWLAEALAGGGPTVAARSPGLWRAGVVVLVLGMLCRVHVVIDQLCADPLLSLGFALLLLAWLGRERAGGAAPAGGVARALAVVGRRSYGTYLVHQPILDGDWLPLGPRLAIAAAASALFSLGCERPFERLARRLGRRSTGADPRPLDGAEGKARGRG